MLGRGVGSNKLRLFHRYLVSSEFRVQVTKLETLLACVPDCVFDDLLRRAMNDAEMLRNELRGELSCAMDQNTSTMVRRYM